MSVKSLLPRSDSYIAAMSGSETTLQDIPKKRSTGDCEDVDKMLVVVVKRRKTIPAKCVQINKEISALELLRLENAKVTTEEDKDKEKFRKIIQEFKRLKSFHFTLDDMMEAEQKLEKYYIRTKEINHYLEKRKKLLK